MLTCIPEWALYVELHWVPILIAAITVLIAFWQWKTAHDKLNLDLFEKRYSIYADIMDILHEILTTNDDFKNNIKTHHFLKLLTAKAKAKFLINDSAASYIWKIHTDLIKLKGLSELIEIHKGNGDLSHTFKLSSQLSHVHTYITGLENEFSPYLTLSKAPQPFWRFVKSLWMKIKPS